MAYVEHIPPPENMHLLSSFSRFYEGRHSIPAGRQLPLFPKIKRNRGNYVCS